MPMQSAVFSVPIFRPLLQFTRTELEEYVNSENLPWIEDESNQDNRYDRNFLRHQILPHL
ncbi:PP-loop family protein [Glaesserella parasuis 29755]|nr:PP-loop family protein [Glaesserella parasuis 29755]